MKPHLQSTVFTLLDRNATQREIHRLTGVDRKTIRRYRALRAGAQANSPGEVTTGPVSVDGQIPPPRPPAFGASEATLTSSLARSACEAHRRCIEEQVRLKRNAQAIYQDLVDQFGFPCSYQSVKRFVRRLRHTDPEQFDRLEFLPGEEAQVDYGEGAPTVDPKSGRYRRPRLFVMTLRYSRRSFRRVVWQSSQQVWAQLHEEAFRYFGGVPSYVVLDNLKEGVLKPDLYEPELNPIYSAMLAHYAVVADPARLADPNRKGCVENAIQHTQGTALAGRRFETLEAQNEFLRHWEENWASKRIHGSTRRQVEAMFQEEKPHLRPLPVAAFRIFTDVVRTVCDDTTVRVDSSYYAARPAPIGSQVVVRIYASTIEIRDRHTHALLRLHPRMAHPGSVVLPTNERPFNPSRQTALLLSNAGCIGPQTKALCQQMFDTEGRVGQRAMWGIVGLSRKYPARLVELACAHAIENRIYRYKHVRASVERLFEQAFAQIETTPPPTSQLIQDHPLIRTSEEYGDLFRRAVRREADDNGRQGEAHDDRAPAIRARRACATPASSGATSAPAAPSHLKLETQPHDDHAGIERCLRQLRLSGVRDTLQTRVLQAQGANQPFLETFSLILQDELDRRQSRLIERRYRQSGLDEKLTLAEFDWSFNPKLPRQTCFQLHTLAFIAAGENALLVGKPGTGKSHIAKAIAYQAILQSHKVQYLETDDFFHRYALNSPAQREVRLRTIIDCDLLVLDDLFLARTIPDDAGALLQTLIHQRYKPHRSVIVTSNRVVQDWGTYLGDNTMSTTILDRLMHHCHLLEFNGRSYRLKEAAEALARETKGKLTINLSCLAGGGI